MLKTRVPILLVSSVLMAIVLLCSGCSTNAPPQVKAAEQTTGTASMTATATETTTTVETAVTTPPPDMREPPFPRVDLSNWKITEAEAIATANRYVPAEVVSHAKIIPGMNAGGNLNTGEVHYYWQVAYMNIEVTKDWLGWQADNQTTLSNDAVYNELAVDIDAVTGEYVSRRAYYGMFIGGIGMTPPPSTPWVAPTTTKAIIQ